MRLMGVEQTAERIGTSISTLRYWIQRGTAPPSAKIGRRRMFRPSDVDAWIEKKFIEDQTEKETDQ
jgi:excisionase family DNA binding protein